MNSEQYERGLAKRRKVLGDAYVDRALGSTDAFDSDFQHMVTEYAWGGSWGREGGLSDQQRSLLNLAMLSALNRGTEFKTHVRGALNNGCTLDDIRETLIQVTIYCGAPAGVEAFRLAREVFEAEGIEIPD